MYLDNLYFSWSSQGGRKLVWPLRASQRVNRQPVAQSDIQTYCCVLFLGAHWTFNLMYQVPKFEKYSTVTFFESDKVKELNLVGDLSSQFSICHRLAAKSNFYLLQKPLIDVFGKKSRKIGQILSVAQHKLYTWRLIFLWHWPKRGLYS